MEKTIKELELNIKEDRKLMLKKGVDLDFFKKLSINIDIQNAKLQTLKDVKKLIDERIKGAYSGIVKEALIELKSKINGK